MVTHEHLAAYLLDRALLDPGAVLDDDLIIRDASSRNHVHRVQTRTGPGFLIKQPATDDAVWTIANEASVYHRLTTALGAMRAFVPGFLGYDPDEQLLVLELLADAQDLRAVHTTGAFSPHAASLVGRALGTLHRETTIDGATVEPDDAAWILWIDRPDARVFRDVSAAGLELIRIVQGTEGFAEALDALRSRWLRTSLIHGDLKWDNCLVCGDRADGEPEVRLIDWESAAPGDAGWDIGSALSQYLSCWIFSIPVTGADPPERFPELAQFPLATMKPAMAACWAAYADERGFDPESAADELIRATSYAGARLVQTAFEALQMMQQLTSATVLHLQLALNILLRPGDAATQLMGISPIRPVASR